MKNISFHRIGLLLKRYFVENWKKDLVVMGIVFAFEIVIFPYRIASFTQKEPMSWFLLFVCFSLFSGRIFGMLGKPSAAVNYLMLPASRMEKLTTNIILSHFYYPPILIAASYLGVLGRSFLCTLLFEDYTTTGIGFTFFNTPVEAWVLILIIFLNNAVMMFGSIYFKKKAVIKTLLCEGAFAFASIILVFVIEIILHKAGYIVTHVRFPEIKDYIANIMYTIMICTTVFFWVLSYFRLKETEV